MSQRTHELLSTLFLFLWSENHTWHMYHVIKFFRMSQWNSWSRGTDNYTTWLIFKPQDVLGYMLALHFTVKFLVDLTRSENETVRFLAPVHPIILISKNRFPGIDFRLQILNSFRTQIVGKLFDTHYKSWPRLWLIVQTERSVCTHENSRENPGACRVCGRKFSKLLASNWKIYCLLWRLNSWHWILWNHYGYYFHVTSNLFFYIGMRGNLHVGQTSHHLNVKSFSEAWNYLQIARNLKIVIWQM